MDDYSEHQNEDAGEHNDVQAVTAGHDTELEALMQEVQRLQAATTRIEEILAALVSSIPAHARREYRPRLDLIRPGLTRPLPAIPDAMPTPWTPSVNDQNDLYGVPLPTARPAATGPSRNGISNHPERGSLARPAATSSANPLSMPRIAMTVPSAGRDEYHRARRERLTEQAVQATPNAMRTFHVDSDPRLSGTSTKIPLRKQRLAQEDPITLMSIAKPAETICGHVFEAESLVQAWTHERAGSAIDEGRCPLCRRALVSYSDMHHLELGERKVEEEVRGEIKRDGEDDSSDSDESQKAIDGKMMND